MLTAGIAKWRAAPCGGPQLLSCSSANVPANARTSLWRYAVWAWFDCGPTLARHPYFTFPARQTTCPCPLRRQANSRPPAAINPSKTGGDSSFNSESCFPSLPTKPRPGMPRNRSSKGGKGILLVEHVGGTRHEQCVPRLDHRPNSETGSHVCHTVGSARV